MSPLQRPPRGAHAGAAPTTSRCPMPRSRLRRAAVRRIEEEGGGGARGPKFSRLVVEGLDAADALVVALVVPELER
eukprot:scaffold74842_cov58-Phaeocystis_antarctica.AAC.4